MSSFFFTNESLSYVRTVTNDGKTMKWTKRTLSFAGNSGNSSGLSFGAIFDAVTRGLQRWKAASGGTAKFDYWQGTDDSIYEPNSDFNGLSSLYFASKSASGRSLVNRNIIGLTQVWFDTATGEILEADLVMNDLDFRFTSNSSDTSQNSGTTIFLENVVTHEVGHAFGLSHSGALQSTMLFVEGREQAKLSCDDETGIRETYPGGVSQGGTLAGRVQTTSGAPVFGAHVNAISVRRGISMGSAISKSDGSYEISELEGGQYTVMVEPFIAGASSLPDYYHGINTKICNGANFGRTFINASNLAMEQIYVSDGVKRFAPTLSIPCGSGSGANVPSSSLGGHSYGTGPAIGNSAGFALVDRATPNGSLYYSWDHAGGPVEIHALSFSLFSPVRSQVDLLDPGGSPVAGTKASPVYQSASGYRNWDGEIKTESLAPGRYTVVVSSEYVAAGYYPASNSAIDSTPFFVLTGAANPESLGSRYPANARCTATDSFGSYQSPSDTPRRYSTSNADDKEEDKKGLLGFCGSVQSGGGLPPPSNGQILGWFMPFMFLALVRRLRKGALLVSLNG